VTVPRIRLPLAVFAVVFGVFTTTYRCGTTSTQYCASNCGCQPIGPDCY